MSIDRVLFNLASIPFLLMVIFKHKRKVWITLFVIFIIMVFGPVFLPSFLFGKWNSIKELKGKTIKTIVVKPFWAESPVNLSDSIFKINDTTQIKHIIHLLENTIIYRAGHSGDIWQSTVIIVTTKNDSLKMDIFKTRNQGTHVIVGDFTNTYNQNELGDYLEKILHYTPKKED